MSKLVGIQKVVGKDVMLWRFMDLSKLLDILVNKHITFPRFDKFDDPFEGYSNNYMDLVKNAYYEKAQKSGLDFYPHMEIGIARNQIELVNRHSYISCWHMNEYESAAMWKLYCTSLDSVAIKTNAGKLRYALKDHLDKISDGGVSYDSTYKSQPKLELINYADPLFTKRESFEHEKEFRMVFHDYDSLKNYWEKIERDFCDFHMHKSNKGEYRTITQELENILQKGVYGDLHPNQSRDSLLETISKENPFVKQLSINPSDFIEEIIIAPNSPDWFFKTVKLTIEKLGYEFSIRKSNLYDKLTCIQ